MPRRTYAVSAIVITLFISASFGQLHVVTLPPPERETTAIASAYPRSASGAVEPYLLRPGHYVIPAPYSPSNWSPHLRPFPDYSGLRRPPRVQDRLSGSYSLPYGSYSAPYSFAPYSNGGHGGDVAAAYNQGRYDADHEYLWFIASHRAGRLLNQSAAQFDEGIRLFRAGKYEKALVNWLGAAEANHDSAAPRLHAGHALFALGRFDEAVGVLARAFELQPLLAYQTYDLRDEYGNRGDFDTHLAALKSYVGRRPYDANALTLLGYVTYYTDGPSDAESLLRRAAAINPRSYFIPKLYDVSRLGRSQIRPAPAPQNAVRHAQPRTRAPTEGRKTIRVRATNL